MLFRGLRTSRRIGYIMLHDVWCRATHVVVKARWGPSWPTVPLYKMYLIFDTRSKKEASFWNKFQELEESILEPGFFLPFRPPNAELRILLTIQGLASLH